MALNFPDAPGIGSVYTDANSGFSWQWSGVVWKNYKQSTLSTINIVDDTTPQLGGDLDLNSKDVGGTGDFNISGIVTATSFVGDGSGLTGVANTGFVNAEQVTVVGVVTASSFVKSGGTSSQFLKADGSVDTSTYLTSFTETDPVVAAINGIIKSDGTTISAATAGTDYLTDISQDTTPQLGGNLDLNSNNITGTGDISVTGEISATAGFNIGISSGGTTITSGPITALNFVGTGNTFAVNGTTVDVSISGGGGASVSIGTEAPTSPSAGDLWYNNEKARTFIYYDEADAGTGSAAFWVDSSPFVLPATDPDPVAAKTSATFTAEANQNGFPFEHTVGFIDVYLNGIRLSPSEFTSDGASVTLGTAASAGDVVDLVQYRMGIGATGPRGPAGGNWETFSINTGITTTVKVQIQNNLEVTGVTTSTGGFVGALTGNVTGNLTGDVTGNVTGNLTGDVTGSINATGVSTFSDNVSLGDSNVLNFGEGDDLQIYHDGSNSYIVDSGAGNLIMKAAGSFLLQGAGNNENMIVANQDGAVELWYDNSKKIETTTSGVTVTGDVNSTSDINIKKNIQVIDNAIDKVKAISGVTFQWKENEELSGGVIAQDVMVLLPELVKEDDNNIKTVNYNGLVGLLIEVVKDQQNQLDELKTRISELEE